MIICRRRRVALASDLSSHQARLCACVCGWADQYEETLTREPAAWSFGSLLDHDVALGVERQDAEAELTAAVTAARDAGIRISVSHNGGDDGTLHILSFTPLTVVAAAPD